MDLGTLIIGAICLAICIIPFILASHSRKKAEKTILLSLHANANRHNGQISQHELHGNFAIGVDENKKYVFFFKQLKGSAIEEFIDLSEIEDCRTQNTHRTVNNRTESHKIIERLTLNFIPRDKSKSVIDLEFFNANLVPQLDGELQLIESWSVAINRLLKT